MTSAMSPAKSKARWLVVGLVFLVLWSIIACARGTAWDNYMKAAATMKVRAFRLIPRTSLSAASLLRSVTGLYTFEANSWMPHPLSAFSLTGSSSAPYPATIRKQGAGRAMRRDWRTAAIMIVVWGLILTGGQGKVAAVEPQPSRPGDGRPALGAEFHYTNGLVLSNRGQLDQALLEFREALRLKPDYVEAHTALGAILAAKDRLDEALREFQEALRLKSAHADAHLYLGLTLARKAEVDRAIQELEHGLRLKRASLEKINPSEVPLVQVVLEQLRFIKKQDEDGRKFFAKQFETLKKELEQHQQEERRSLEKNYRDAMRDHEKNTKNVMQSVSGDVERKFLKLLTIRKLISP